MTKHHTTAASRRDAPQWLRRDIVAYRYCWLLVVTYRTDLLYVCSLEETRAAMAEDDGLQPVHLVVQVLAPKHTRAATKRNRTRTHTHTHIEDLITQDGLVAICQRNDK